MSASPNPPEALERLAEQFAELARERPVGPVRFFLGRIPAAALIAAALALLVAASLTPPGRAIAEEVAELVGIGDSPTVDHDVQGGPLEPTTDEIVIGTGSSPDGVPFEIVAFEGERSVGEEQGMERRAEELERIREELGAAVGPLPAERLDPDVGTCVSLDWPDRPDPVGGATCIDGPQRDPLPIPATTDGEGRYGPGAELIVRGLAGPEVERLDLLYTDHDGDRVAAPLTLAKLEGEIAERAGTDEEFGFFVAFLPDEDVGEGGYLADVMTTVELIAYRADGEEAKRLDYGRVVEAIIARRSAAQADAIRAEAAMEAARAAGEIKENQNPCTYPRYLREIIEPTDEPCGRAFGRTSEGQQK